MCLLALFGRPFTGRFMSELWPKLTRNNFWGKTRSSGSAKSVTCMRFQLLKKRTDINKTEQIKERSRLLKKIFEGCAIHPAYDGDGPATGVCKTCLDVREAYLAFLNLDKNDS